MKVILALMLLTTAGICQQPGANENAGTESVQAKYRNVLALEAEFAARNAAAQQQGYKLGAVDQRTLGIAEQARLEAELKLAAFDAGITSSPFAAAPNREEALRKCRSLLEEGIALAKAARDYFRLQAQLGAVPDLQLYESRIRYAAAESRLALWDAGLQSLALQAPSADLRNPAQWPRSEIEIRKDILHTQEQLKASEPATAYKRAVLELRLKMLQGEMDASSKH